MGRGLAPPATKEKPVAPNYGGLVHAHNPSLAVKFTEAGRYATMLEEAICDLKVELDKVQEPDWE